MSVLSCRGVGGGLETQVALAGQKCVHIVHRVRNRLSVFYLLWVLFQSLMLLANVTPARDVRNGVCDERFDVPAVVHVWAVVHTRKLCLCILICIKFG